MIQKQALELVLHWLCDPDPKQGFAKHREDYEDQLQSIARLQAACKLDVPCVKVFMRHCWDTMLSQYAILLRCLKDNGDCTRKWWIHENARVADLQERGPRYALQTLQMVARKYDNEKEFLFEAGGGVKAAADYNEYLAHQYETEDAWGDPASWRHQDSDSSDTDSSRGSEDSGSDADLSTASDNQWALERARFRAWAEGINAQRWTVIATMLQKCPGLRPYGGKLREACKDHVTFERAWVRSWPWIQPWPPLCGGLLPPELR